MYSSDLLDKMLLKAKEVEDNNKTPSLYYFSEIDNDMEKLKLHANLLKSKGYFREMKAPGGYYRLTVEGKGFIKAGGFKTIQDKENEKKNKTEQREKEKDELIKLQIDLLKKKVDDLDAKNADLERELKEEQLKFFKSSTERNKKQILYYVIIATIAMYTFVEGVILPGLRWLKII